MPEPAPPADALRPGEVHVWQVALASTNAAAAPLLEPLSQAERERAARFRFEKEQARYVSTRSALRQLLGRYAETAPEEIVFRYEAQGKPLLAGAPQWQFNVSHSRDQALVAIARRDPVGIDLERLDPDFPREEVGRDILAADELRDMRELPASAQTGYFFSMWTLKEALLKAAGRGLSIEPRDIHIRLNRGGDPEVISAPPDCLGASLFKLEPRKGFAAALAVLGEVSRVEVFEFPPPAA